MMVHELLLLPALPPQNGALVRFSRPSAIAKQNAMAAPGTGHKTGPAIFLPGPEFALSVDSLLQIFRNRPGPGSFSDRDRPAIDRQPGFPHLVHTWEHAPVSREHADRSFFSKKISLTVLLIMLNQLTKLEAVILYAGFYPHLVK